MATLVLTAVGTTLGGPIGGALGAIVGQAADAAIFAPKARQGPRLGALAVQTSSYGSEIPKIFGTMRVAGTVIWATDLRETRSSSGGGKGRPKTIQYSYSASFAVALSGRPIRAVRRIWADGKLLRGQAGDFKTETGYRLYPGNEAQLIDPLIASAEGIGQAPAFRGIAYAIFEDFQLADYGNRIPSLTFEIEADEGPLTIGTVAAELSDGSVRDDGTPSVIGYAASGDTVRGAIEALSDIVPLTLHDDGERLHISAEIGAAHSLAAAQCGATGVGGAGGRSSFARGPASAAMTDISLVYYDIARDYQAGLQRATRRAPALRSDRRALPAALSASAAKAFAERRLSAAWAERSSGHVHLGWRDAGLRPGAVVRIEGQAGAWRIRGWTLDRMVVSLDLARVREGAMPLAESASPGRPVRQPDLRHGPTVVHLLDVPLDGGAPINHPRLLVAAAGVEPGWRGATLSLSHDGGASWQDGGSTAAPAVMGLATSVLDAAGSALIDAAHDVEVTLLHDAMWLESRSDAALVNGANLAALGDELIQFGRAEPLGANRFRLSRLLRGRRGTEWAATTHVSGEAFILIEPASLAALDLPAASIGGEARVIARGVGDGDTPPLAVRRIDGEAVRPPSPMHLKAQALAGGDVELEWVRRSRAGWAWLDGSDTPLGEEAELYRLTIAGAGFERSIDLTSPSYLYPTADLAADSVQGPVEIRISQIGAGGASHPTQISFG